MSGSFLRVGSDTRTPLLHAYQQLTPNQQLELLIDPLEPQKVIDDKISNIAQCRFCYSNKNPKLQSIEHTRNRDCQAHNTPLTCLDCASIYEICLICMEPVKRNISRQAALTEVHQQPIPDDVQEDDEDICTCDICCCITTTLTVVLIAAPSIIAYGAFFYSRF